MHHHYLFVKKGKSALIFQNFSENQGKTFFPVFLLFQNKTFLNRKITDDNYCIVYLTNDAKVNIGITLNCS